MKVQDHLQMLGLEVEDKVTKFRGIVTCVSFELYGCIQYAVHPPVDRDGKIPEGRWMDFNRAVVLNPNPVMVRPEFVKSPQQETRETGPEEKPLELEKRVFSDRASATRTC